MIETCHLQEKTAGLQITNNRNFIFFQAYIFIIFIVKNNIFMIIGLNWFFNSLSDEIYSFFDLQKIIFLIIECFV